jgi:DNA polymerase-1
VPELSDIMPLAVTRIAGIKKAMKCREVVLCFTDTTNFRKAILPTYKASRSAKPLLLQALKDALVGKYRSFVKRGLEGDDVMGILATHPTLISGTKLMYSIDKDLKQIPGWLFNPGKDTLVQTSVQDADYFHMYQTLTGDTTDNYTGIPGVGHVYATAWLEEHGATWAAVVAKYAACRLTEEDALIQARVARILRHTDYDFKRKEPILWTPSDLKPRTTFDATK